MGPIYQSKAVEISCKMQKKIFHFDKYMCVGKTLNLDSCSKFGGNLKGIWESPGEIPHIGWKTPRVYRVNQVLFLTRFLAFFKLKSLSFMSSSNWGVIHSYFILLILNFLIGHKVSNIFLTIL